jgi:hypothetical protein
MKFVVALVCLAASAAEVPAGAVLSIRLQTGLTASAAKSGQGLEAVVIAPLKDYAGAVLVPSHSKLSGKIKDLKIAQNPDDRSQVRLVFDRVASPSGATAKIDSRVVEVDNARETVDEKGDIVGILASETLGARMDRGIGKLAERYPALGSILAGVKAGIVQEVNTDIRYEPGVEMNLRIDKAFSWNPGAGSDASLPAIATSTDFAKFVNKQPFRRVAENPPDPSDITNLMFIGTEQEVAGAFKAAGWTTAHALNRASTMETIRAVIEQRGYKEAPVSLLLLDGRPPDLVFEKQNNTFAERHHLRIWRRPGTFNDRPVWVCAATHDIGIDFSEENHTFIHRIDPHIDRERSKVVADLTFTAKAKGVSMVDRDRVPKQAQNATGDELITDGRMAVLEF